MINFLILVIALSFSFFSLLYAEKALISFKKILKEILSNSVTIDPNNNIIEDPDDDMYNDIDPDSGISNEYPDEEDFLINKNTIQIVKDTKIKFDDIAGNEEAKEELKEVIKFLIEPLSFTKLGAVIPKGVLLGGPPGTGKTLLAKAIAGEAGVPFLKISGSQFVEMLAGVGASRVQKLFKIARLLKPSIIFIDEIDSIAKSREGNTNMTGASDEREQALNQILVEMDGFDACSGVIVIAASNRVETLDPALMRAGRFDRQISINYPNFKERVSILKVHARGKKIDASVSLPQIAQCTVGFSGADLANVLNEAAILATRRKKKTIEMVDINSSIDRIIIGLEVKQSARIKVRQIKGFHEMAHAFITSLISESNGIEKLTFRSQGSMEGIPLRMPLSDQYTPRSYFINQVLVTISGRATEESIGGHSECTVSAQDDLSQMTRNIRTIVLKYAMTRLQEIKQEAQQKNLYFLGNDIKQEINNLIDNFTTNFLNITYKEIFSFFEIIRPSGERLVDQLLSSEELNGKELRILAKEHLSAFSSYEILYRHRESLLSDLVLPNIKK